MSEDIHVYPIGDKKEHKLDGVDCDCSPKIEVEGANLIIIHNAYDHREITEEIRSEKLSGQS